jgi:aryl-alcohol dehydrogenase-like predicted oxidoreductase
MIAGFSFPMRLGFGCSGALAQRWHPAVEARQILIQALEGGIRHFDTAPFYADGEAERRLGEAIRAFGDEGIFVSTKTGTKYRSGRAPLKNFSDAAVRRDVEGSLRRLRRELLDLVYLHGPSPEDEARGVDALVKLQDEGKVGLIGICGAGDGLLRAARNDAVEFVMGVYNFLRREHAAAFSEAKRRGKGVVAIAPLAQGLYDRRIFRPASAAGIWRLARALIKNRAELKAAANLRPLLDGGDMTAAQTALAFVHANSSIDVALTTTTNPSHLAETLAKAGAAPDADLRRRLALLDEALKGA